MTRFDQQGPGIFFVIPCIDAYKCVDLRTVSFDVPPQEVFSSSYFVPFVNGVGWGGGWGFVCQTYSRTFCPVVEILCKNHPFEIHSRRAEKC